jgi:hypothetical protein
MCATFVCLSHDLRASTCSHTQDSPREQFLLDIPT